MRPATPPDARTRPHAWQGFTLWEVVVLVVVLALILAGLLGLGA